MIVEHNENTMYLLDIRHMGPNQEDVFREIKPIDGSKRALESKYIVDEFGAIPSNSKRSENEIFVRGKYPDGYFNIWIGCRGKVKYVIWMGCGKVVRGSNLKEFKSITKNGS